LTKDGCAIVTTLWREKITSGC